MAEGIEQSDRRGYRSVRARLALAHAVALTVTLAVYSLSLYYLYRRGLYADLDVKLRNDLEATDDVLPGIAHDPENWLTEVWSPNGQRLATTSAIDEFPLGSFDPSCVARGTAASAETRDGVALRVFCQESSTHRGGAVLRVARSAERTEGQLADFRTIAFIGMPAVVALSILFGFYLARRALAPVAQITAAARRVSASRLSERLPVANPRDELGALATTFNEVFADLERSFQQMRRFTADASHELRTPLTAIRALGEVALGRRGSGRDPLDTIASILEESGRLQSLCDSLLLLSRADAGQITLAVERIDVARLVHDIVEFLAILAEEKRQTITVEAAIAIESEADPKLLKHAISNLLENAIKYSPSGATIRVMVSSRNAATEIAIADDGPGIAEDQHELIFRRFYRVDTSRARSEHAGGAGLGLSIALWAVELHGGTIRVASAPDRGSTFTIALPRQPAEPNERNKRHA